MTKRLIVVLILAGGWLGLVSYRLYDLQVRRYTDYLDRATSQQRQFFDVHGPRGSIYDRRGRQLAVSVESDSVYGVPGQVADADAIAKQLGKVLHFDRDEIAALKTRLTSDRSFVWVQRKLRPEDAQKVHDLGIEGIGFVQEVRRYYPFGSLLGQVLGFTGMDDQGLAGLEVRYDEAIRGTTVERMLLNDGRPGSALVDPDSTFADPEPGAALHLTIDASIQHIAEKELAAAVERTGSKWGTIVLLDPADSAVLAMANYPPFDPNEFRDFKEEHRRNRAIFASLEPGSTFKMITAAAAFEHSLVHPEDRFYCGDGSIRVGRRVIRDHHPYGELSFREIIAKSSNVGVVTVAQMLGEEALYEAVRAFGFGEQTGIDLPDEAAGIVHPVERWGASSWASISFGHEIAVTPLQLANAFAVVANGGLLYEPYVVRSIGESGDLPRPEPIRVISKQTVLTLERVLEDVVIQGTGRKAQVVGYGVAGKTGTAQKIGPDGRYSQSLYLASFAGMVPARKPRLVGVVMLDEPRGLTDGGDVAAPVFSRVTSQALLYLGVAPDREFWAKEDGWLGAPVISQEPLAVEAGS